MLIGLSLIGPNGISVGLICSVFSVFSNPVPACDRSCTPTDKFRPLDFMHVSDLEEQSMAPWELKPNVEAGRKPEIILSAECKRCNLTQWTSKPIHIRVWVYKVLSGTHKFCRCPLKVAVGCTCVKNNNNNNNDNNHPQLLQ